MLRSMYSGISGMRGFQTKLDVIGNNIANVNTAGYKKSRVTFQEMMSQTTRGAQGSADDGSRGGINPMQVGLGSKVGSIDTVHSQGFLQPTDHPLDLAIEGDGLFRVDDGNRSYYTRAGNFYLDDDGNIVNASGYYLVNSEGISPITIPVDAVDISISANGDIVMIDSEGESKHVATIGLAMFSNPSGLLKQGSNLYAASPNSGNPMLTEPGNATNGAGELASSVLEMSNVDLAEEFTEMIVTQRGFQANTRIITTSDEILQELVNLKR
jgi:flagellar hook protein FlgE